MRAIGIIPARFKSSRFPGKPLALILNKPMILHVAEKVEKALGKENTYIATDDERIKKVAEDSGYNVLMTPESCLTGTDRIFEASKQVEADIYVNIQGDEPIVNPSDIVRIVEEKKANYNLVINGMCVINENENPDNTNIPKVLVNKFNRLIYMSRLPIPGNKSGQLKGEYKKQVCIYAFNKHELYTFGESKSKSDFEALEDIEILRFFDFNIPIQMVELKHNSLAVDIPEDILKVEEALKNNL